MTATTKASIVERLQDEHPRAIDAVGKTIMAGAQALTFIKDEATMYDTGLAIEAFVDAIGVADHSLPVAFDPAERPVSDDARPLYQRLSDDVSSPVWKGFLRQLNQAEAYMSVEVAEAYHAELEKLWAAFGLPLSRTEFEANRDAYPGVS